MATAAPIVANFPGFLLVSLEHLKPEYGYPFFFAKQNINISVWHYVFTLLRSDL